LWADGQEIAVEPYRRSTGAAGRFAAGPDETMFSLAVSKTAVVESLRLAATTSEAVSWNIRANSREGRKNVFTQSERTFLVCAT
jgi:hypothetical protein